MMKRAFIAGILCLAAAAAPLWGQQTQPAADSEWPQWRGPNRNGIAPHSPKLLDTWPKEGPKLLWQSEPIPSGTNGGCGSVTVAGGKAFVFVHWRYKGAKSIVITTRVLNELGWLEGVPDELAKRVEEARRKRGNLQGAKLEAYIKDFFATLDPETTAKYGAFAQQRLKDTTFEWKELAALATMRDQEFNSWEDLWKKSEKAGRSLIFAGDEKYNAFRDQLVGQGYHYTDTIICLDAENGKEIWKKEFPGVIPTPNMMMYIGASCTPAVWEDKCYVAGSAGFYCLSVKDGSPVWQVKTSFSNSSPLIHKGVVYCCVPQLAAFDANTGKILWEGAGALQSDNASVVLWENGGKDYIVGANGTSNGVTKHPWFIFCVDAATGRNVWSKPPPCSSYATPVIEDGILATIENSGGRGYEITPEGAVVLWSINVPDYRGASLLASNGYVYASTGRYFSTPLRCFDLRSGQAKWTAVGDHGGNAEGASPIMADGKILAQIKDPDTSTDRGGSWTVMFRAAPEKFEELGQFHSSAATCVSPAVANGKLYLRQQKAVACWDIAEHRPYMSSATVAKDTLVLEIKQAEGGLAVNGAIEGLILTDASGKPQSAKAQINGESLVVDLKGAAFPIAVSYAATGNLGARNGPLAPFEWRSPRLRFERCEGSTLVLNFERFVDGEAWKSEKAKSVEVSGAKITGVELDRAGETLRLATDKTWKTGDTATLRYSALPPGASSERMAELAFIVTPGRPVTEEPLLEFLYGELREKIDPKTIFEHDDLDKNIRPVAGEKWKAFNGKPGTIGRTGNVDLGECFGNNRENCLGHVCVYVRAETDCKVQFWVYADDGMQIIVNGRPVYTEPKSFQKSKIKDVELKKGWNALLLGVTQTYGFWGFSLYIRNEEGDGVPAGLRYTSEAPNAK
ncbi:MAG: PQQ-binding-like beta-propeller repeat protein [Planctomycetota bacterium]|nr:PQQ-binding-like beta-propeller repeat protein [Planctomycetota bacterium]